MSVVGLLKVALQEGMVIDMCREVIKVPQATVGMVATPVTKLHQAPVQVTQVALRLQAKSEATFLEIAAVQVPEGVTAALGLVAVC